MEVLHEFVAELNGATVGAWVLAAIALWKALKANERLDEIEKNATSKGANNPRDHLSDASK